MSSSSSLSMDAEAPMVDASSSVVATYLQKRIKSRLGGATKNCVARALCKLFRIFSESNF